MDWVKAQNKNGNKHINGIKVNKNKHKMEDIENGDGDEARHS